MKLVGTAQGVAIVIIGLDCVNATKGSMVQPVTNNLLPTNSVVYYIYLNKTQQMYF